MCPIHARCPEKRSRGSTSLWRGGSRWLRTGLSSVVAGALSRPVALAKYCAVSRESTGSSAICLASCTRRPPISIMVWAAAATPVYQVLAASCWPALQPAQGCPTYYLLCPGLQLWLDAVMSPSDLWAIAPSSLPAACMKISQLATNFLDGIAGRHRMQDIPLTYGHGSQTALI